METLPDSAARIGRHGSEKALHTAVSAEQGLPGFCLVHPLHEGPGSHNPALGGGAPGSRLRAFTFCANEVKTPSHALQGRAGTGP